MSEQIKKTLIITVSVLGVLLLVILISSSLDELGMRNSSVSREKESASSVSTQEDKLPVPTGNIDDAVLSAESGIVSEDKIISESDGLTSSLLDDNSEVSSFSQTNENIEF